MRFLENRCGLCRCEKNYLSGTAMLESLTWHCHDGSRWILRTVISKWIPPPPKLWQPTVRKGTFTPSLWFYIAFTLLCTHFIGATETIVQCSLNIKVTKVVETYMSFTHLQILKIPGVGLWDYPLMISLLLATTSPLLLIRIRMFRCLTDVNSS